MFLRVLRPRLVSSEKVIAQALALNIPEVVKCKYFFLFKNAAQENSL